MSLTPRLRADILRLYRHSRRPSLRSIGQTLHVPTSTVARVVREAGVARRNQAPAPGEKIEWRCLLPRLLSDAADRARGTLSRTAYFTALLRRTLDAEARQEGP